MPDFGSTSELIWLKLEISRLWAQQTPLWILEKEASLIFLISGCTMTRSLPSRAVFVLPALSRTFGHTLGSRDNIKGGIWALLPGYTTQILREKLIESDTGGIGKRTQITGTVNSSTHARMCAQVEQ